MAPKSLRLSELTTRYLAVTEGHYNHGMSIRCESFSEAKIFFAVITAVFNLSSYRCTRMGILEGLGHEPSPHGAAYSMFFVAPYEKDSSDTVGNSILLDLQGTLAEKDMSMKMCFLRRLRRALRRAGWETRLIFRAF